MKPDLEILDYRRTSPEFAEAAPDMALLPLGATEQHGAHLPCGTDTMQADYLADEIARRMPIWRLPTIPVTISHMHADSPGSVWITNETLMRVVKDIVLSLRRQGVRKVVVLNYHGGNFIVRPIIQDLNRDYDDISVILLETPEPDDPPPGPRITSGGCHATEGETSAMLHIAPDLVKMDLAVDTDVPYTQNFLMYAPIKYLEPAAVWGCATRATVEKGRALLEWKVDASVRAIQETFKKVDEIKQRRR